MRAYRIQIWLDHILVATQSFEDRVTLLLAVLYRLRENRFSVNFPKTTWCASNVKFMDMLVNPHGVRTSKDKIAAIPKPERLQTVGELRAMLVMTRYSRKHVEGYSIIGALLMEDILRNSDFASKRLRLRRIPWGSNGEMAFRTLKARVASP